MNFLLNVIFPIDISAYICYNIRVVRIQHAPVAQLDRVTGYEPVGRGFESLLARLMNTGTLKYFRVSVFLCLPFKCKSNVTGTAVSSLKIASRISHVIKFTNSKSYHPSCQPYVKAGIIGSLQQSTLITVGQVY